MFYCSRAYAPMVSCSRDVTFEVNHHDDSSDLLEEQPTASLKEYYGKPAALVFRVHVYVNTLDDENKPKAHYKYIRGKKYFGVTGGRALAQRGRIFGSLLYIWGEPERAPH